MSEMIERVAKAMNRASNIGAAVRTKWDDLSDVQKNDWRILAHYAFKAMRKPTLLMQMAAKSTATVADAEQCWIAMIDEALK